MRWRLLGAAVLVAVLPAVAIAHGGGVVAYTPDERLVRVDDLIANGALDEAEAAMAPLLEDLSGSDDDRRKADVLRRLASLRRAQRRHADAEAALHTARDIYASLDASAELGMAWRELGGVHWALGRLREAPLAYIEAASAFARAGRVHDQAGALRSSAYGTFHETREAKRLVRREALALLAGEVDTEPAHRYVRGALLHDIGDDAFSDGRYADADRAYREAEQSLVADAENRRAYSLLLTSRGRLERAHGYPERALPFYERALALQRATLYDYGLSQTLNALATTYQYLDRYAEARQILEQAVELYDRVGPPWRAAAIRIAAANAALLAGDVPAAVAALDAYYATGADPSVGVVYRLPEVVILQAAGRLSQALDVADTIIANAEQHGLSSEIHARAYLRRATVLQRLGRPDAALLDLTRASDLWESMRRTLTASDYIKRGFAEVAARSFYPGYVAALAEAGEPVRALEAAELARGRAFVDLLAQRQIETRRAPAAADVEAIETSTSAGLQQHAFSAGVPSASGLVMRGGTVPSVIDSPPDVAVDSLAHVSPLAGADMRHVAAEEDAVVAVYWQGDEATLLWVLQPGREVVMHTVAVAGTDITRLVVEASVQPATSAVRSAAGQQDTARGSRPRPGDARARTRLFELLVAPFADALPRDGRLVVVPHGALARLSFATLVDRQGRYLVERASVRYAPSVTVLHQLRQTRPPRHDAPARAVVVGDPRVPDALAREANLATIPGARAEASAVARVLEARGMTTDVLTGRGASEEDFRSTLHGATVVHVAAHGVISDAHPMTSYLALAGTGADGAHDGRLTAAEVYDLRLDADLVVLSGCRTADGPATGDGISGLTRAFFAAGTRSVVASLWDLPDETARHLLPAFYRAWQGPAAGDKAEALRRAQVQIIQQLRRGRVSVPTRFGPVPLAEHPSLWGGLALIGAR